MSTHDISPKTIPSFFTSSDSDTQSDWSTLSTGSKSLLQNSFDIQQQYSDRITDLRIPRDQFYQHYSITRPIHESNFSLIYEVMSLGTLYIMKEFKSSDRQQFLNELLMHLYCLEMMPDQVVRIEGWVDSEKEENQPFLLILEKGDQDLAKFIVSNTPSFSFIEKAQMIKQITEIGIKLRQINVAHNDLKPSQFIYFASQQRIKLNDFGSALYEGNQFNHFYNFKVSLRQIWQPMTPQYMPLEQINFANPAEEYYWCEQNIRRFQHVKRFLFYFSYRADSYSLGMTLVQLVFPNYRPEEIKRIFYSTVQLCDSDQMMLGIDKTKLEKYAELRQSIRQGLKQFDVVQPWQRLSHESIAKLLHGDFFKRATITALHFNNQEEKYDYDPIIKMRYVIMIEKFLYNIPDISTYAEQPKWLKHLQETITTPLLKIDFSLLQHTNELKDKSIPLTKVFTRSLTNNFFESMFSVLTILGIKHIPKFGPLTLQTFAHFLVEYEVLMPEFHCSSPMLTRVLQRTFGIHHLNFAQVFRHKNGPSVDEILTIFAHYVDMRCPLIACLDEHTKSSGLEYVLVKYVDIRQQKMTCVSTKQPGDIEVSIHKISDIRMHYLEPGLISRYLDVIA